MKKIFSLLLFLIIFTLFNSNVGAMQAGGGCSAYIYSNCPIERCDKICIASECNRSYCTSDCDGPGSLLQKKRLFVQKNINQFVDTKITKE